MYLIFALLILTESFMSADVGLNQTLWIVIFSDLRWEHRESAIQKLEEFVSVLGI